MFFNVLKKMLFNVLKRCFSMFLKDGHEMLQLVWKVVRSEFRYTAQEEQTKSNFLRNISGCRQTLPGGVAALINKNTFLLNLIPHNIFLFHEN